MSKESITRPPPINPTMPAKIVNSGVTNIVASRRGTTRKRSGSSAIVVRASISSFTFIVPISAAKAAPVRPASTIDVINGASSRNIDRPIRLATNSSAPNWRIGTADW